MIDIKYDKEISIITGDLNGIFTDNQLPLKFEIKNVVSKKVIWETNLSGHMWAKFPNTEINDVVVSDAQGNFIYRYYWDVLNHGSIFYKSLWLYCKSIINQGRKPKGLVIGSHDGEFGEWVPLVRNFMSDIVIVEASDKQFQKLTENYSGKDGVKLMKEIVTPDGKDVIFFEGGAGYTNTIIERVIRSWETEEIKSVNSKSISINQLIEENFEKLDWLHLDVEGLDAKLLLSLDKKFLPNFIIYEDYNLENKEREEIDFYFGSLGYSMFKQDGIGMMKR